jgi:Legionella pneumophila major outer membrane protein precursor
MQDRDGRAALLFHLCAVCVPALALLSFASPVEAAEKKYQGFFVALDYALTQPNSLDQHFATHVDASSNPVRDERLVIDNDAEATIRGTVGYRLGPGRGNLQVSYWSFENDDRQDGVLNGGVYPTIMGYPYGGGMYIYNAAGVTYGATSTVKARAWDLDYIRQIPMSSTFSLKWLLGLRAVRYQEAQSFSGSDGMNTFLQEKRFTSEAIGMRVGVAGVFNLTRRFSLEGSMAVSFLQADTEGLATATFPSGAIQTFHGEDDHLRGNLQDYGLRAVWSYGPLDYFVGYSDYSWSGLPTDPVPAGGCCSGSLFPSNRDREAVSFNALHAGVLVRFGGYK